jgi:hypothetical protein
MKLWIDFIFSLGLNSDERVYVCFRHSRFRSAKSIASSLLYTAWWSNRLPTDQRSMISSVSLVVSWAAFILGLFLWPYIVGGP